MDLAATLDDYGKPAWIALMVAAFIVFWPAGLAILAYLIWSGRMGSWKNCAARHGWHPRGYRSSGNSAFDEYREETLRRMKEEQREFENFMERLRRAKDKEEFDQFMAEQRRAGGPGA